MPVSSASSAAEKPLVMIKRHFNLIAFKKPDDPELNREMVRRISVSRKVTEREGRGFTIDYAIEPCYQEQKQPSGVFYLMGFGFYEQVKKLLEEYGYRVDMIDVDPADATTMLRMLPNMKRLEKIDWREDQRRIINDMLRTSCGQYKLSTGAGKSFTLRRYCEVLDKSRICIANTSARLLEDMYREILKEGRVDATLVKAGSRPKMSRVMLCTVGTLHYLEDTEFDTLLLDEKHECATLKRMAALLAVKCRQAYAFSANHADRLDGADGHLTAMFGELRDSVDYSASVAAADVVPIQVDWISMGERQYSMPSPGSATYEREVYWRNERRNQRITDIADTVRATDQTLVYAKTVEHVYQLRKSLDCPVVHAVLDAERWDRLKRCGLVGAKEIPPTEDSMRKLRIDMSAGKQRIAICNSVWKKGVDFRQLGVLIRADGSTSVEDATQIGGRLSRVFPGKTKGILIDVDDTFCETAKQKSLRRKRIYRQLGYQMGDRR